MEKIIDLTWSDCTTCEAIRLNIAHSGFGEASCFCCLAGTARNTWQVTIYSLHMFWRVTGWVCQLGLDYLFSLVSKAGLSGVCCTQPCMGLLKTWPSQKQLKQGALLEEKTIQSKVINKGLVKNCSRCLDTTAFGNTLHCTEMLFSPPAECMCVVFLVEWPSSCFPAMENIRDTKTWTNPR